jgi:hypothetical protein
MRLYIAIYPTPDLTSAARMETEKALIDLYSPLCNRQAAEPLGVAAGPAPDHGARLSKLTGFGLGTNAASSNFGAAGVGWKGRK